MAGTTKGYATSEIVQGPGDIWVIGTAPNDAGVRLTLASDGTPDSTAHPGSIHLGAIQSAITTTVKPKIQPISLDQYDAPFDGYVTELSAKIEAEMAQTESQKLQRMLGVGAYATGAGYKHVTFGGLLNVPKVCIAVISPTRANPLRFVVSILYVAVAEGGFQVSMGRAKASTYKASFVGLSDPTRTAGKQIGAVYQTLSDAAAGTPTAKNFSLAEIYQGPADLWLIAPAPTDAATRVTIDAATLTPDIGTHATSVHLGMTTGPVAFSVTPKMDLIKADQFDAPVDAFIASIAAKIDAEMNQSAMDKLARALGVGNYSTTAGSFAQTTFGGVSQPPTICVAAIAPKRLDNTKAICACLYSVNSVDGLTWVASRQKTSTYKMSFIGLLDPTRTAGRQMGLFQEMI
jgi:hypothetical protein